MAGKTKGHFVHCNIKCNEMNLVPSHRISRQGERSLRVESGHDNMAGYTDAMQTGDRKWIASTDKSTRNIR
jgi:hypothetical protein